MQSFAFAPECVDSLLYATEEGNYRIPVNVRDREIVPFFRFDGLLGRLGECAGYNIDHHVQHCRMRADGGILGGMATGRGTLFLATVSQAKNDVSEWS